MFFVSFSTSLQKLKYDIKDITTSFNGVSDYNKHHGHIHKFPGLLLEVDIALNTVLLGVEVILAGVLKLVAKL